MNINKDWRIHQPGKIIVLPDAASLLDYIAKEFVKFAQFIQKKKQFFSVMLGGGRTPVMVNARLAAMADQMDWSRIKIFFSDERCVPPDHAGSNFRMIHDTLVKPLRIPVANVLRIKGELNPEIAAAEYEQALFKESGEDNISCFDLALLGLGPDGHTASLFPDRNNAFYEKSKLVVPAGKGPEGIERITLTYFSLNSAQNIWFMISGTEKRRAFHQILYGNYDPLHYPAQGVRPIKGELLYITDRSLF